MDRLEWNFINKSIIYENLNVTSLKVLQDTVMIYNKLAGPLSVECHLQQLVSAV
jgi:hypothetical protein